MEIVQIISIREAITRKNELFLLTAQVSDDEAMIVLFSKGKYSVIERVKGSVNESLLQEKLQNELIKRVQGVYERAQITHHLADDASFSAKEILEQLAKGESECVSSERPVDIG